MNKTIAISAFILLGVTTSNVAYGATSALTADIVMGAPGEKVVMLQDFLRAEGHFSMASTGYFGPVTAAALKSYQTKNGLTPTGTLDTATVALMQTETDSAEVVAQAAMERHPEKVPMVLEGVRTYLKSLDVEAEGTAAIVKQMQWAITAFASLGK